MVLEPDDYQPQLALSWTESPESENPRFYRDQIITYIGNKRALLGPIGRAVAQVQCTLNKQKLRVFDGFSGSGVVSRLFKSVSDHLTVNDIEPYARVVGKCFLTNRGEIDTKSLSEIVNGLNCMVDEQREYNCGFIERLYAPADDESIQLNERVFYTQDNARRLDSFRALIGEQDPLFFDLLMGPLLGAASVHANTAGVFKGFYKDKATGKGRFGGSGEDALQRIKAQVRLQAPILSCFECNVEVHQRDTNELIRERGDFDLAYFDPPYNQHPYGSNYFMLNLLVHYNEPKNVSSVSGIPSDWNRSSYNQRRRALESLADALYNVDAHYILLSYNDEGFVSPDALRRLLEQLGPIQEFQLKYNAFRGSRNLRGRKLHVTEHLFLVQKKR